MGKKFIILQSQKKKYRLFSEDIKMVYMKGPRKVPTIPRYQSQDKSYDDDTEEESCTTQQIQLSFSSQWFYYFSISSLFSFSQ